MTNSPLRPPTLSSYGMESPQACFHSDPNGDVVATGFSKKKAFPSLFSVTKVWESSIVQKEK